MSPEYRTLPNYLTRVMTHQSFYTFSLTLAPPPNIIAQNQHNLNIFQQIEHLPCTETFSQINLLFLGKNNQVTIQLKNIKGSN